MQARNPQPKTTSLADFGKWALECFTQYQEEHKYSEEEKQTTDYQAYEKQIGICIQKANLTIKGCNELSKKSACVTEIDKLTKTEDKQVVQGPISSQFAKDVYVPYLRQYALISYSTAETVAASAFSMFGGKNIAQRKKEATNKADEIEKQIIPEKTSTASLS